MQCTIKRKSKFAAWLYLSFAILLEVIGTSFMADAARFGHTWGYGVMAIALALSYYLLSCAIQKISVGVAYAVWEAVGLVLLALVGVFLFHETLVPMEVAGLGLAVLGIVLVAMGEEHKK